MIAAPSLEYLLKPLIGRPRPEGAGFGFPSGHTTAAAYIGALIQAAADLPPLARRFLRAIAATLVVLVGLARIVLRAHWPSDVLGGIALGFACAVGAAVLSSYMDGSRGEPTSQAPRLETK